MTPQAELYQALSTNAQLLQFVSEDRIMGEYPPIEMFEKETIDSYFPRLTFVLGDRRPTLFADNEPILDTLQFDIDIWLLNNAVVTASLNQIKLEVDKIMLGLGYFKLREEERQQIKNKLENLSLSYTKEFPSNL